MILICRPMVDILRRVADASEWLRILSSKSIICPTPLLTSLMAIRAVAAAEGCLSASVPPKLLSRDVQKRSKFPSLENLIFYHNPSGNTSLYNAFLFESSRYF